MSAVDIAQIVSNLNFVREKIDRAAQLSGRKGEEITLVAVTKTYPDEVVEAIVSAGVGNVGESRVREGAEKVSRLGKIARWHLIGHLQSNKAGKAVAAFDMIQSLDSLSLARKVSDQAAKIGKSIDCLVELNSSGEKQKFGFAPQEIITICQKIAELPNLRLRGLMTIAPHTTDSALLQKSFDSSHSIYRQLQKEMGRGIDILSMGMSSDYEQAIASGSNMVRVGTALFGQRKMKE